MKQMACYLVLAIFIMGLVPKAEAGFIPSQMISPSNTDGSSQPAAIQKELEHKMVRDRLEKFGFTDEEINSRLSRLSDEQMHTLSLNLDQLRVGGDVVEIIFTVLFIVATVGLLYFSLGQGSPQESK